MANRCPTCHNEIQFNNVCWVCEKPGGVLAQPYRRSMREVLTSPGYSLWKTPTIKQQDIIRKTQEIYDHRGRQVEKHDQTSTLQWHHDDGGFYEYIQINGPLELFLKVQAALTDNDIGMLKADKSIRAAGNGIQYDWYIRLDSDRDNRHSSEELNSIMNPLLRTAAETFTSQISTSETELVDQDYEYHDTSRNDDGSINEVEDKLQEKETELRELSKTDLDQHKPSLDWALSALSDGGPQGPHDDPVLHDALKRLGEFNKKNQAAWDIAWKRAVAAQKKAADAGLPDQNEENKGIIPELLAAMLMMAGTTGIIGNQVTIGRVIGYFPPRRMVTL